MNHSFIAYIDESGDDGLGNFREPGSNGGASSWLVISACVFRYMYDLDAVSWRDEISSQLKLKRSKPPHFTDLNHQQRVFATQKLADKPIRAISVASHKRTIGDDTYGQKNQLYFYLTRYLIERISWLCRDHRPNVPQGNGSVKIVFSRRGGMSYTDFQKYLERLKVDPDVNIHWPVVDITAIQAMDHSRRAGLQLADIIASATAAALELDVYGNCESRYAEILKPIVYSRRGNYLSYGLKILPMPSENHMSLQQLRSVGKFK